MKLHIITGFITLACVSGAQAALPDATTLAKVDKIFNDWRLADSARAPLRTFGHNAGHAE